MSIDTPKENSNVVAIVGIVMVTVVIIAGGIFYMQSSNPPPAQATTSGEVTKDSAKLKFELKTDAGSVEFVDESE